jgi:hypothetical protein
MKICLSCKIEKSLEEFNRKGSGHQTRCRNCQKIWYASYYRNSEKEKNRLSENRNKNRAAIDLLIKEAKDVPCMDCGIKYPHYVMDFDHLKDKEFNIGGSRSNKTIDRIKLEIDKCEVVCSNCHRIRTYERRVAIERTKLLDSSS